MNHQLTLELEQNGIVLLSNLVTPEQLRGMQKAFEVRLRRMRWNDFDGYEKTELYREMIQDVLTLDQGFVDVALHPLVKQILREYIGEGFQLVETKGWRSLATKLDFHGWHGDAWYDQKLVKDSPREVKMAMYLTEVRSGAFHYIKGTHHKQRPRPFHSSELQNVPESQIVKVTGPAGSAFLFDTSGIHRQGVPMLEPRQAIFFNYHDPAVPLQEEDRNYYRYHPLLLNSAFLGKLSDEDMRILGFGDKRNYVPAYEREAKYTTMQAFIKLLFNVKLRMNQLGYYQGRLLAKAKRAIGLG